MDQEKITNNQASCLLCAGRELSVLERSADPYRVLVCPTCDYAFVWPLPTEEVLIGAYDQMNYYVDWVTAQAARRERMWRWRAGRVLGGQRPGRLLDVGCGVGSFLHAAQALGWEVAGTEISETGCRISQERWGITPFCGPLEQANWPSDSFDMSTLWHVIEHVPDPVATLREVVRLTRPGGRIILACPNRRARLYNVAYVIGRGRWPHLFHPSDKELHLSHFTVRSLRRLLERCSLRMIQVDVDRGHIETAKRAVALASTGVYRLTGLLWSDAMEVWAQKPSEAVT